MLLRRRQGFTLIELLVVIAIIAILAAMLFPVFARARESARKIQCLSNVKNIALAVQMYLTDYDRFPPGEHDVNAKALFSDAPSGNCGREYWANPYLRWPVILDEYIKNRQIWSCPSAKWDPSQWWIIPSYGTSWVQYLANTKGQWDYHGYTPGGAPCDWAFPTGWGGTVTDQIAQQSGFATPATGGFSATIGTTASKSTDVKTAQIDDPSWYVVAGDGTQFGVDIQGAASMTYELCGLTCGKADWANCPQSQECGLDNGLLNRWWTDSTFRAKYTRHLGGSNLGFGDGHAAWFSADALIAQHKYCDPIDSTKWDNPDGRLKGLCGKY